MNLQREVASFLEDERSAEVLSSDCTKIYFDLWRPLIRQGWIEWVSESAVTVELGVGMVSEEEVRFVEAIPHSRVSTLNSYLQEGQRILTWESTAQQLPRSKKGISEVLTPIFNCAEREFPNILLSLLGSQQQSFGKITSTHSTIRLSSPQGHA